MLDIHSLFGVSAAVLQLIAFGIYVASIIKGKTKPNRVTWWILTLVQLIIVVSYYDSGARDTVWLPAAYALCYAAVAILSLWYGEGPATLDRVNRISLAGAGLSIAVWIFFRSPISALYMGTLTELIGLAPTIYKTYSRPKTESSWAWSIATLASLMNVIAIPEWSFVMSAYPLYVLISNALITYFIVRPQKQPA